MRKTTITMDDVNYCKYAVMFKGDEIMEDYAVAMFGKVEDAEKFAKENYIMPNDEIYIAEVTLK